MKNKKTYNKGMTLPELVLAIFMLIAFTGFTVMIVQYTYLRSRINCGSAFCLSVSELKKIIFLLDTTTKSFFHP